MICDIETHWPVLRRSLDVLGVAVTSCPGWSRSVEETLLDAPPECILVGSGRPGLRLCREIRATAALHQLDIIALVGDPWSGEAKEAFAAGVDDYLPWYRIEELGAKLRALAERNPSLAPSLSGKAIVADPDRNRRIQLGRAVHRLGLDVVFALDTTDVVDDGSVRLVVANATLQALAPAARERRNDTGQPLPWIICGTSSELHQARESISGGSPVGFYDIDADPSQLVFIANSLFCGQGIPHRRSKRLPYEGPVRMGLRARDTWGFIYNINHGGLYVRTLTPPHKGARLTLEFQPPFGRGRVLVDGEVIWRQGFPGGTGYQPGCGIELRDLAIADAAALSAGYEHLLEQCGELFR